MSDSKSELHTKIKNTEAELDRFEKQAVTILFVTLTLAVMSYSVLLQVLP